MEKQATVEKTFSLSSIIQTVSNNNPPSKTNTHQKYLQIKYPHLLVNQTKFCYIFRSPITTNRKPSETPTHHPLNTSSEFPTLAIYPNSGIHITSEEKSQLT